jgi:flagellar biosynthesis GTPase FlhF
MAAARQNDPPREAVNLGRDISQLLSSDDDQLQFESDDIFDNLERWISIEVSRGTPVYDNLSVYMVRAFTTLLDSFIEQHRIIERDKLTIVAHLNRTMNHSLQLLDHSRDGKYTEFCSYFFGATDGKEARDILEALSADSQCNAVIGKPIIGITRCWICNLKLSGETKPQCEHILPIIDALFYLNLYQYSNSFADLGALQRAILVLEYLWSEKCCNETKNNDQWLAFDEDGICYINRYVIKESMKRIMEAANNREGGRECWEHLREYVEGKIKAKVDVKANIDRIEGILQPIVDTINSIVGYIDRRLKSGADPVKRSKIDGGGKKQAIRAITVFKYLTLIRFLSNVSGSKMVEAFMNNVVHTNAAAQEARKQKINAERAAERAAERDEIEQRKAQRAARQAAKQAEKESDRNRRLRVELEEQIRKLSEVEIPNYERLQQAATSERGQLVQARQIQRVQLSIAKLQEELAALPMAGGQRGGTYAYKTHILPDFQTEMHYIMLLSFYPIYINLKNKGDSISEEEYMSIPGISDMAMRYFNPTKATLIDLSPQKVETISTLARSPQSKIKTGIDSKQARAKRISFNKAMRSAKRTAAVNETRKIHAIPPVHAISPVMEALPFEMSYGGRTRKRSRSQKRITRKK